MSLDYDAGYEDAKTVAYEEFYRLERDKEDLRNQLTSVREELLSIKKVSGTKKGKGLHGVCYCCETLQLIRTTLGEGNENELV